MDQVDPLSSVTISLSLSVVYYSKSIICKGPLGVDSQVVRGLECIRWRGHGHFHRWTVTVLLMERMEHTLSLTLCPRKPDVPFPSFHKRSLVRSSRSSKPSKGVEPSKNPGGFHWNPLRKLAHNECDLTTILLPSISCPMRTYPVWELEICVNPVPQLVQLLTILVIVDTVGVCVRFILQNMIHSSLINNPLHAQVVERYPRSIERTSYPLWCFRDGCLKRLDSMTPRPRQVVKGMKEWNLTTTSKPVPYGICSRSEIWETDTDTVCRLKNLEI
jgi:hypothetical protein